jgi:hypothetical protein
MLIPPLSTGQRELYADDTGEGDQRDNRWLASRDGKSDELEHRHQE